MLELVLNLFFPPVCGICGKQNDDWLCDKCFDRILITTTVQNIDDKEYEDIAYIFRYEHIRNKILEYKFFRKSYLRNMFVTIIFKDKKLCDKLKLYDIIIPVPMSKKKKARRGYNQTELICEELAKKLKIEYKNKLLFKSKENKRQSSLNKNEREQNIKNIFRVNDYNKIKDKTVILFDDIITTGATINECAKELKKAGAKKIFVLALAKD